MKFRESITAFLALARIFVSPKQFDDDESIIIIVCPSIILGNGRDILSSHLKNNLFISRDNGETFTQVQILSFGGKKSPGHERTSYKCLDVVRKEKFTFLVSEITGTTISLSKGLSERDLDFRHFSLDKGFWPKLASAEFIELSSPKVREIVYVLQDEDNAIYYVDDLIESPTFLYFRLFKGYYGNMKQIQIRNVHRYQDGGSTFIITDEGTLFVPAKEHGAMQPMWLQNFAVENHVLSGVIPVDGVILTKLDTAEGRRFVAQFDIPE